MVDRIYGSNDSVRRRSGYVVSMPEHSEEATRQALAIVREDFHRRPQSIKRALALSCSDAYIRQMFTGHAPMSLDRFELVLTAVSRDCARAALQALGEPRQIDCAFRSESPTSDLKSEVVEAAAACGRAFVEVDRAIADGRVTDTERTEIDRAVAAAKAQLDDIVRTMSR